MIEEDNGEEALVISAGIGSISGMATARESGEGIEEDTVSIEICGNVYNSITDDQGNYTITDVPAGRDITITAYADDYNLSSKDVEVVTGEETRKVNFDLIGVLKAPNIVVNNPAVIVYLFCSLEIVFQPQLVKQEAARPPAQEDGLLCDSCISSYPVTAHDTFLHQLGGASYFAGVNGRACYLRLPVKRTSFMMCNSQNSNLFSFNRVKKRVRKFIKFFFSNSTINNRISIRKVGYFINCNMYFVYKYVTKASTFIIIKFCSLNNLDLSIFMN